MVVERVAELAGRHLKRDSVEILEVGGCNEMRHVADIFGINGFDKQISILIDEDAENNTASALGIASKDLASRSVFVSRADLEDEYVSAIGADELWNALRKSSLFTPNMLKDCAVSDGSGKPNEAEIAKFCRTKQRKIFSAVVACRVLDKTSAQQVSSVIEVLQNAV